MKVKKCSQFQKKLHNERERRNTNKNLIWWTSGINEESRKGRKVAFTFEFLPRAINIQARGVSA